MFDFQNERWKKRLSQSHIATVVVQESGGGKMNQEQVDAMCPEERRRREEVKREVSDASWCGHDAFQSKDPVVEGGTWNV